MLMIRGARARGENLQYPSQQNIVLLERVLFRGEYVPTENIPPPTETVAQIFCGTRTPLRRHFCIRELEFSCIRFTSEIEFSLTVYKM